MENHAYHGNLYTFAHYDFVYFRYIIHRIQTSQSLLSYICPETGDPTCFSENVQKLSQGSILYVQSLIDLIERGFIVIKEDDFSAMPKNLSDIFLLQFNLRYDHQGKSNINHCI